MIEPSVMAVLGCAPIMPTTAAAQEAFADRSPQVPNPSRRLLIVTDVGKDIDDTVALATIVASDELTLVGVVTSGGNTTNRAKFARQLLRVLGVEDEQCDVIAGFEPEKPPNAQSRCYGQLPDTEGLPLAGVQDGDFIPAPRAAGHILDLVKRHPGLTVVCLGPLTPLQQALESDDEGILKTHIGSVYCQGCDVDGRPDPNSFNFSEDMAAATAVFESLRGSTPFCLVGKFAAYEVSLHTQDILEWDDARPEATRRNTPSWLKMTIHQMRAFRDSSTELYFDIYPVDVAKLQREGKNIAYVERKGKPGNQQPQLLTDDWYMYLKDDVLTKPYDPLVVVALIAPQLFTPVAEKNDTFIGNTQEQPGVSHANSRIIEVLISERVKKASRMMKPAPASVP